MWWDSLTDYQQILFIVAVSATAVMVIFIILMLIGFDQSQFDGFDGGVDDMNFDVPLDDVTVDYINDEPLSSIGGLKIFTIRGSLAFLSMGSWVTFLFVDLVHPLIATLIGAIAGFIAAYLLAYALKQAMKLESSGNIDYQKAIGKTASVYLRIPKDKSGKGKINLVLDDRYVEVEAMTEEHEDILVNKEVSVIGITDEHVLIVKKI